MGMTYVKLSLAQIDEAGDLVVVEVLHPLVPPEARVRTSVDRARLDEQRPDPVARVGEVLIPVREADAGIGALEADEVPVGGLVHELDVDLDADRLQVGLDRLRQLGERVHVVTVEGGLEPVGKACLGQQPLGLLGVVRVVGLVCLMAGHALRRPG